MGMKELQQLSDETAWKKFLDEAYQNVKTEHSKSKRSWLKTRVLRPGNKVDTVVNTAAQVGVFGGAVAGGAAVAGVTVLGAGATGAAVVVIPALIGLGALGYWGYNKADHHKVNEEIWKYYNEHPDNNRTFKVDGKEPEFKDVKKWLGWFGDEGISNMEQLENKLREAQAKFHSNCNSLDSKQKALFKDIALWATVTARTSTPQSKEQQKQNLMRRADALANEYMKLAQDLQYIWYRLERTFMYFEMFELTAKSFLKKSEPDLAKLENEASEFFNKDMVAYQILRGNFSRLPVLLT